jgi:hypothetical protein
MAVIEQIGKSVSRVATNERACAGIIKVQVPQGAEISPGFVNRLFVENSFSAARQIDIAGYLSRARNFSPQILRALSEGQIEEERFLLSLYLEENLGKGGRKIDTSGIAYTRLRTNVVCALTGKFSADQVMEIMREPGSDINDMITTPHILISSAHTDQHFSGSLYLGVQGIGFSYTSICSISATQGVHFITEDVGRPIDYTATYHDGGLLGFMQTVTSVLTPQQTGK